MAELYRLNSTGARGEGGMCFARCRNNEGPKKEYDGDDDNERDNIVCE